MQRPRIEILLDRAPLSPEVRQAVARLDARTHVRPLGDRSRKYGDSQHDARLILSRDIPPLQADKLDHILKLYHRDPCATLILSERPAPEDLFTNVAIEHAIDMIEPPSVEALVGRLQTMCKMRASLVKLHAKLHLHRQQEARQLAELRYWSEELRLAEQVQRALFRHPIPEVAGLTVHPMFAPADRISGDIHGVYRLDEHHVAFFLADATGHGVAAALMSVSIKNVMQGKRIQGQTYHLLEPDEVLRELNHYLLDLDLIQGSFVAALYAVYDERARTLRWARAGTPFPLLSRPDRAPRFLESEGVLAGVVEAPEFEVRQHSIEPGEVILFYSDGLEALVHRRRKGDPYAALDQSDWFQTLGERPFERRLSTLREWRLALTPGDWDGDDVTVLALEGR